MWKCHKCGKPVYFAERKQSLGYDWHPECLRCEECGKRLNPGQHAEHKGVPYCHVPCYGALFGPQLFGHGTKVESHKSFGVKGAQRAGNGATNGPNLPRDHMESKLKVYNQFYDNKSMEIRSREVNNRLILEGALRVYWGVQGVIHLKEDDDQRTFVVRKRNSYRISKNADDSTSDKENDSESLLAPTTTSEVDPISTDISLTESMTFDSCSLNEYAISELPTTPEEPSALTTDKAANGILEDRTESQNTTSTTLVSSSSSNSCTLPSKLDKIEKLNWDEIDEMLQVERRLSEKDNAYETMPVKLPSSAQTSSESSPTKISTDLEQSSSTSNSNSNSNSNYTSSDQFLTATNSLPTQTQEISTNTTNVESFQSADDATLKPMDYEEFKRSVHQDYVNGANSFQEPNDDTLKRNQPIDPSRIHDSLKLYGEHPMSKSFNCEQALRSIEPQLSQESLKQAYTLQKSGSQQSPYRQMHMKGINRSKSGPSCFDLSDSDEDSTLKPQRHMATVRRSDIPPRFIQIQMNCYDKPQQENELSEATNSGIAAGDELTQTSEMITANSNTLNNSDSKNKNGEEDLHVTEDGVVLRRPPRTGAAAIKRRSGNRRSRTKLKRRCSINGHFYNRETSFFTPPYGSQMSVWVTSLVTTQEVINLVLEKYKVDSPAENFSLFIIRDNGEQKRLKDNEYPLITRVMLGPHEDVARLFLVDARKTDEISNEVAQFINLSVPECRAILERYDQELEREMAKIKEKFSELRRRIIGRMESLKVHL